MSEVLYRATKYMNAEDALSTREKKPKRRERQDDIQQEQGRKKARTGDRRDEHRPKPPGGRFTSFTPLTAPVDQVLMQIKDEEALTYPGKLKGAARIWFSQLAPNSISTFKELSAQFTTHFIGRHRYKKSTACLMSIKQ